MEAGKLPFSEDHRLQFLWEVFNATKTEILGLPALRPGQDCHIETAPPDFGRINQIQGSPRIMLFALRQEF